MTEPSEGFLRFDGGSGVKMVPVNRTDGNCSSFECTDHSITDTSDVGVVDPTRAQFRETTRGHLRDDRPVVVMTRTP